jgi:hypothetical protein
LNHHYGSLIIYGKSFLSSKAEFFGVLPSLLAT